MGRRLLSTKLLGKASLETVLVKPRPTASKAATKREEIFASTFQAKKNKN